MATSQAGRVGGNSRPACLTRSNHAPCAQSSSSSVSSAARITEGRAVRRSSFFCGRLNALPAFRSGAVSHAGAKQQRGSRLTTYATAYQPFPFDEGDYYRAHLQLVQSTDPLGTSAGNLVFMKEGETVYDKDKKALVLSVGGDTLSGIANQVQRRESERPMSLDLLWQVLGRGLEVSKRDWRLVRVAIVGLRNDVYYGRLFFGDTDAGGKVVWDCDCRPSDACWLSLKAGCPVFIKRDVFDAHAVYLSELMSTAEEGGGGGGGGGSGVVTASAYAEAAEEEEAAGTSVLTRIRKNDPDPIKRLKREMEVALREEDYATAARIRDHPFMKLHVEVMRAKREGNPEEASQLEQQLERLIHDSDQARGVF